LQVPNCQPKKKTDTPKILIVDDELSMREFLEIMLLKDGYDVWCAASGTEAIEKLRQQKFDLVITDIRMRPVDGLEVLRQCRAIAPSTVVIIISAYASAETAVAAMKEGAYDYLPKPFKIDEMRSVLRDALKGEDGLQTADEAKKGTRHFGCIIGESPGMYRVYELIRRVAATSSNVLITGESGTGKELVANAIHSESPRHDRPFVVVNCGGVPEALIESELFGYKKGAFTGAASNRKGLVEAAQGGTLFLDEIGELSIALQVKLLRLVQTKSIRMIGDTEDISVDVRIISATNRDLEKMVIEGAFREDLYYRLNVLPIKIPPLRERPADIPILAHHYLALFAQQFGKNIRKVSAYAMDVLKNYDFPGNVRELEHIIERGVALEASNIILPDSLTIATFKRTRNDSAPPSPQGGLGEGFQLDQYLGDIETKFLQQAMQEAQSVKLKAARLLGISFRSFRYRLLKYGLETEED
jgi:two-component system response regulator PilR (NtrC family)